MLCEQHVLINMQRAEYEWSCKNACTRGGRKKNSPNKMLSGGVNARARLQPVWGRRSGCCSRRPPDTTAAVIPLSLNYYLLELPLALLASPLASSVPFIAFLNNFYKWGGFQCCQLAHARAQRSAFTHQSLIEARVLVFSNKAHLKNLDANYFALFMHSPSPCRFKHFRGHLDSSNYLCLGRLRHE